MDSRSSPPPQLCIDCKIDPIGIIFVDSQCPLVCRWTRCVIIWEMWPGIEKLNQQSESIWIKQLEMNSFSVSKDIVNFQNYNEFFAVETVEDTSN